MSKEAKYIVVRDGFWQGVIGDFIMYGCWIGVLWFNHKYLGDKWWIGLPLVFIFTMAIAGKYSSKFRHEFTSKEDAIKYLKEQS